MGFLQNTGFLFIARWRPPDAERDATVSHPECPALTLLKRDREGAWQSAQLGHIPNLDAIACSLVQRGINDVYFSRLRHPAVADRHFGVAWIKTNLGPNLGLATAAALLSNPDLPDRQTALTGERA
jgi:hypothetical protein